MKLHIKYLLIFLLFLFTFFLYSCSKKECEDKTEPIVYFSEKSQWSGLDTHAVQLINMLADDKLVTLSREDINNRKIRVAHFANQMAVFLNYTNLNNVVADTIFLTYQREKEYTGSECGFKIIANNITITKANLHVAKTISITSSVPQQLQLVY